MRALVAIALACAACGDNLKPIPSCRELAASDAGTGPGPAPAPAVSAYDETILADVPVAFWDLGQPGGGAEPDVTGSGNTGTYVGTPGTAILPDGELAADFRGSEYLSVPSPAAASFSIPTTGSLTWEAWMKPDALEDVYPGGYINWMGKCADFSPTCEWEARFYDAESDRCNRFSAYAFAPTAGLGAGADWQPVCGSLRECAWHHVIGEYTLAVQPAACPNAAAYPGSISIWVDGIAWDQPLHTPTGCMSEYGITPVAGPSPLLIGASAPGARFDGAIGKVAIYNYLLAPAQIAAHYRAMTGETPSGSCAASCRE